MQTLQRVQGRLHFLPPKTGSSARTVPFAAASAKALRNHRIAQLEERLEAGFGWTDTGLVFISPVETPLELDNLRPSRNPLPKRSTPREPASTTSATAG